MKTILYLILLIVFMSSVSCEKIFMHPKPETDNLSLFDEYTKICIEKFGLEQVKGINLSELADSIRPFVTPDLSEKELFDLMGIFVDRMKEGHTSLYSIDNKYSRSYYYFLGYPSAMNNILANTYYYGPEANPDVQIIAPPDSYFKVLYGFLPQDKQIGYIRIISFSMKISDAELEKMMAYLKDAKGIIIDVRNNIGGYIDLVGRLTSYFTIAEITAGTNYIKNGPDKEDFAPSKMTIKPSGSAYAYTKPVVVLHDRITFSSGSLFCIIMDARENTTSIGQVYGGGTGDIMDGFLANGWGYTISTSNFKDNSGKPTDPGIEADIPMVINPSDTDKDAIIERAISELK